MYYYRVKLHALASSRENNIPFPEEIKITPASVNDLTEFKEVWSTKENRFFFDTKTNNNFDFLTKIELST